MTGDSSTAMKFGGAAHQGRTGGRTPMKLERCRASECWGMIRVARGVLGGSGNALCRGSGGVEAPAERSNGGGGYGFGRRQ